MCVGGGTPIEPPRPGRLPLLCSYSAVLVAVGRYYHLAMAKEKVTLTLDADSLRELRDMVGNRSLSAAVDAAVAAYLARLRHLAAVDEWLLELEREHGPAPAETLEWAARLVDDWETTKPDGQRLRAG